MGVYYAQALIMWGLYKRACKGLQAYAKCEALRLHEECSTRVCRYAGSCTPRGVMGGLCRERRRAYADAHIIMCDVSYLPNWA